MALLSETQRVFGCYGVASDELRWTGRPGGGILLRPADAYYIPFALMWCAFVTAMEISAIRGGSAFMAVWGIPFALIGIQMLVGRFFWDSYRRSKTWYGLTTDSALIVRLGMRPSVQRIYLPALNSIRLNVKDDGSGTILFGDSTLARMWGGWPGSSSSTEVPSFEAIADAQRVYDLCTSAQRATTANR